MSDVIIEKAGAVVELVLDRPKKKNALTHAMYSSLADALDAAALDDGVRAVLVGATGETFCAGNDVHDFMAGFSGDGPPPVLRFIQTLVRFPKPIVAAVHGAAVGIGATMLLHCDLVYASETARLQLPFVTMGLVPEAGSSLLLPLRVGRAVASEMALLGAPVDARRARELGLVNDVVAAAELRLRARARAEDLARLPPRALRAARDLMRGDPAALGARIAEESARFFECLGSPEAREAFTAFLERRPPDFSRCA
jgi:enoyl-CoA hydratase/carnithine racemase